RDPKVADTRRSWRACPREPPVASRSPIFGMLESPHRYKHLCRPEHRRSGMVLKNKRDHSEPVVRSILPLHERGQYRMSIERQCCHTVRSAESEEGCLTLPDEI